MRTGGDYGKVPENKDLKRRSRSSYSGPELRTPRESEIESGTFAGDGFGPDAAAVTLNNAPDVGEADADAFKLGRGMQSLKDAEQFAGILHVKTNAVVSNVHQPFGGLFLGGNFDASGLFGPGEFESVGNKVEECLAQQGGIAFYGRQWINGPLNVAAFGFKSQIAQDRLHEFVEGDF